MYTSLENPGNLTILSIPITAWFLAPSDNNTNPEALETIRTSVSRSRGNYEAMINDPYKTNRDSHQQPIDERARTEDIPEISHIEQIPTEKPGTFLPITVRETNRTCQIGK